LSRELRIISKGASDAPRALGARGELVKAGSHRELVERCEKSYPSEMSRKT